MYRFPRASKASAVGPLNVDAVPRPSENPPTPAVPAIVVTMPSVPRRRITLFPVSAMKAVAQAAQPLAGGMPGLLPNDPILLPDAQSLIRRSGAAAPLLEAVRDRKTRDTIRTVIDQLDRDGVVPPASRP